MRIGLQVLYAVVFGALGLAGAQWVMLRLHTNPATAFAYVLFFMVVQWFVVTRFRSGVAWLFPVSAMLCVASAYWMLRFSTEVVWEQQDGFGVYSVAWRCGVAMVAVMVIPEGGERLLRAVSR